MRQKRSKNVGEVQALAGKEMARRAQKADGRRPGSVAAARRSPPVLLRRALHAASLSAVGRLFIHWLAQICGNLRYSRLQYTEERHLLLYGPVAKGATSAGCIRARGALLDAGCTTSN
jgi:hypothetical protein